VISITLVPSVICVALPESATTISTLNVSVPPGPQSFTIVVLVMLAGVHGKHSTSQSHVAVQHVLPEPQLTELSESTARKWYHQKT